MRMIATILGCPFRLSIFPEDAQEDAHMMQYANLVGGPKRSRKQKAENETEEMYQQTLVFDEKLEPVIEPEPIGMQPKADLSDKDLMTKEDEMPAEEPEELPEEDERDMTIGELYDIHEELSELEEQKPKAETEKRGTDRFRTGGLFFRRKGKHGEDREREEAERLERIAKEQAEKKEEDNQETTAETHSTEQRGKNAAPGDSPKNEEVGALPTPPSKTILIAEDTESNFILINAILGRLYRLKHAKDGMEAVTMFEEVHPDLILMDMKMPNLGGIDATRIIRELVPDVPIIALTAYAYEHDKQAALEAGCNDFLTKPFTQEVLKETIKKWLDDKG